MESIGKCKFVNKLNFGCSKAWMPKMKLIRQPLVFDDATFQI
jgi:hypothetical protein